MKLIIDLAVSKVAKVSLIQESKVMGQKIGSDPLTLINELLSEHRLSLANLDEIAAVPGPGSFTGLKVGAAIADALNWSLGKNKRTKLIYEAKSEARDN